MNSGILCKINPVLEVFVVTEDDIIGEITEIETFAKGTGVHIRQYLNRQ